MCYWVKQVIGLLCGVCFGVMPVVGATAITAFIGMAGIVTYIAFSRVLRADLDRLGPEGQWQLVQEGFMPALGTFLLTWTVGYTLLH